MAESNIFDKYGIKEVADITFYRTEKKEETYESQRTISISSILKGAVEIKTVYPMVDGIGDDEGFQAYVFSNAELIKGTNYDCDDVINATITYRGTFTSSSRVTVLTDDEFSITELSANPYAISSGYPKYVNNETGDNIPSSTLEDYEIQNASPVKGVIKYSNERESGEGADKTYTYTFVATFSDVDFAIEADLATGIAINRANIPDENREIGTHEYTYFEQAFMLFAKRQNLIAKTGARYRFENIEDSVGNLKFEDGYAIAPKSTEQVVVLGLVGIDENIHATSWSDTTYDLSEIEKELSLLTQEYEAKAYDVIYSDYAELAVEDEMGYYSPHFLGQGYDKATKRLVTFSTNYRDWVTSFGGKIDYAIANATMWGNNQHYSINDAIDALKQQQKILDSGSGTVTAGINSLFGGYKVSDSDTVATAIPAVGSEDIDYSALYSYYAGTALTLPDAVRKYSLESVMDAISEMSSIEAAVGSDIRADINDLPTEMASNRAIYVNTGSVTAAQSSWIYLLHNKNYRKITADTEGIFTFSDKIGNKLYYQDKIFKKVEWLALVIIGNKGMIFVVNHHGSSAGQKIAWMINESGYIDNKKALQLVDNGLLHTTDITVNGESFEATCSVKSLKVRKIIKMVNYDVPVLFLDSLKITNLNQTGEEVYAKGGKGNSNLIGWDYGKEIKLDITDALFTPASMALMWGAEEDNDFRKGVKKTDVITRMEKVIAKRSFIVPAGNQNGMPSETEKTAQAVFLNPDTLEPYADGTPIAQGEIFLKQTRSVAYGDQSLGQTIEISADKFPGTYKVVGETCVRSQTTGKDERFQFTIQQAKIGSERTLQLESDGEPVTFDMSLNVLRPDNGLMLKFTKYEVEENTEENDGSTMVKGTENLNLLDDAELFRVNSDTDTEEVYIGATEY